MVDLYYPMKTRSQTRQQEQHLYVEIDFDEASAAWRKNKKPMGQGCYTYICGHITKQGTPCQNKPILNGMGTCFLHK
jgi:hypothetical protein